MNEYEILLMLDPDAPEERHDEIIARTRELIERGGGTWQRHEPWGRRKLAYEIDHKTDGVMRHLPTRRPMPHRRAPAPVGGGEQYAPPTEAESEGGA